MSGHNKWSKIKRQKATEDNKRGTAFTKYARAITLAVREGGEDPAYNVTLRIAIETAKNSNMPKNSIQRAVDRGAGKGDLEQHLEEVLYEGYGPENCAVMVQALTDNRNRTSAQIKHIFSLHNGNLGGTGSVAYQFHKSGVIQIDLPKGPEREKLLLSAIEWGVQDIREQDYQVTLIVNPQDIGAMQEKLSPKYKISLAKLSFMPNNWIEYNENSLERFVRFIDDFEELDDVISVTTNVKDWDE